MTGKISDPSHPLNLPRQVAGGPGSVSVLPSPSEDAPVPGPPPAPPGYHQLHIQHHHGFFANQPQQVPFGLPGEGLNSDHPIIVYPLLI